MDFYLFYFLHACAVLVFLCSFVYFFLLKNINEINAVFQLGNYYQVLSNIFNFLLLTKFLFIFINKALFNIKKDFYFLFFFAVAKESSKSLCFFNQVLAQTIFSNIYKMSKNVLKKTISAT